MAAAGFRNDNPEHLQALREALVNLIIHTDYFSRANPRIRVFSNRIEFLIPVHSPKNRIHFRRRFFFYRETLLIAKIFRFVRLAESIGSGFHKMIKGWEQHYGLEPRIEGILIIIKLLFQLPKKLWRKTVEKILEAIKSNPKNNPK